MRKGFALLAIAIMVATGSALANVADKLPVFEQYTGDARDITLPKAAFGREATDTIWFGGSDPGTGLAREGYIWDWDTDIDGRDPFQGWTSSDNTENPDTYFGRVTAEDFTGHGDGCVPMILETEGQLWVGIHQDEADQRDFIAGMGYQNLMCQNAYSPLFSINPDTDAINVGFLYFNDTEVAFDYTYVHVIPYDGGSPIEGEEYMIDYLDGIIGSYESPATYVGTVVAGTLPAETDQVLIRLRMEADGGWSDEDGSYNTFCGPFACDNMTIQVGAAADTYNWDTDEEGWTFEKCPGIGKYMGIAGPLEPIDWAEWLEFAGVLCECDLQGNALECVDEVGSPVWPPGHPIGHEEMMCSNVIAREGTPYQPPDYNSTVARWHNYVYMRYAAGTFYRPGWKMYPYSTEVYPEDHWSPRIGQDVWYYTGDSPDCYLSGTTYTQPPDGTPLPAGWDSLRAVHEVVTNCDNFGIPPTVCTYEGETWGSPVFDNYKVGLTGAVNAPALTLETGHLFHDCFGQTHPFYLEPCDPGNCNVTYDISRDDTDQNDWHSDTALVIGPNVGTEEERWACDVCFKITTKGPCQDRVPGYHEWKARFNIDPEVDWACARMDSYENWQGGWPHKYHTYFHEDDPAFDEAAGELTEANEILPDGLLVPGTEIEYKYRAWWWNGGAPPEDYFELGSWEMAVLPGMQETGGGPQGYDWEYPSVLYIDGYNRGSEYYINPLLDQMGLEVDKFDALDGSSNWDCPIKRSFGGTHYNPGGWGNNGCTENQLLGYRLILVNCGAFGTGWWEHNGSGYGAGVPDANFVILENWLESTDCELADVRRGLILNGDGMGITMHDQHRDFMNNVLGVTFVDQAYREYNNDWEYCVYLEPTVDAEFEPAFPYISLFGNGCPQVYDYNVLGVQPGVDGVVGNLRYYSYLGTGDNTYVNYAEVVRENIQAGIANWKTVVDGFSFHHVSERGCGGEDCNSDSNCVVDGAADLLGPMLDWIQDPNDPFVPWRYTCEDSGIEDGGDSHLTGAVSFLYNSRPNPFTSSANLRFRLASECDAKLAVYDVSGRLVKTLVDGKTAAGEHSLVWDGTDNAGRRLDSGIFWMKLTTDTGYNSDHKIVVLK